MYLNKVFIIGNLTRDPELKALPSGMTVASFSVATNRTWKDKNGAKQEAVDYHNVVVFGKQADIAAQYLKKGASVYIEGRLQTRSWDGQDGKKNYRTEIIADRFQFGPRAGGAGAPRGDGEDAPAKGGKPAKADEKNPLEGLDTIEYPSDEINPEDIPF
jgi:single-strand DNA-binding protein